MRSDPFAAIRVAGGGSEAPTAYVAEHPEHPAEAGVFQQKPQKTAIAHREHPAHLPEQQADEPTVTLTGIDPRAYDALPADWAAGLRTLNAMERPRWIAVARWHEVVLDAHRFAWMWIDEAIEQGWSTSDLIGFDPAERAVPSLVRDIVGGTVLRLFTDDRGRRVASIAVGNRTVCHYAGRLPDAPPLWDYTGGRT